MDTIQIIGELKNRFGEKIREVSDKNWKRATLLTDAGEILSFAECLYKEMGFRFIIATALHTRKGFEILYHFSMDSTGLVLNIRVILPHDEPEIESLSNLFSAANWIEREMHELFGINFRNHPNQEKLISEGNWAEGVYPYRKEFHSSNS
jgi:NADH:ubiquinone oxidoreductase subunit C